MKKKLIGYAIIISIVPFLIQYILINGPSHPNFFSNEVWFSFLGSYVGIIVTTLIFYYTLKHNQAENDRRNRLDYEEGIIKNIVENPVPDIYIIDGNSLSNDIIVAERTRSYIVNQKESLRYLQKISNDDYENRDKLIINLINNCDIASAKLKDVNEKIRDLESGKGGSMRNVIEEYNTILREYLCRELNELYSEYLFELCGRRG